MGSALGGGVWWRGVVFCGEGGAASIHPSIRPSEEEVEEVEGGGVRAELYAIGSLMSSSPWESSSFFSSVLARELWLLWAPMYRVAYTGLVKLVGCEEEEDKEEEV